jgi:menaquinone-specific isochorismate synthase
MPVVPFHANLLQGHRELCQFLAACQQVSREKGCGQIISISLEIPLVDPLAVFQVLSPESPLHFYVEKGGKGEAIAAFDAAVDFTANSGDRFTQTKDFINATLANTLSAGALNLPFSGQHFFCSFTFFAPEQSTDSPFPGATVFLPRWQVSRSENHCLLVANCLLEPDHNIENLAASIWQKVQKINLINSQGLNWTETNGQSLNKKRHITQTDNFKLAVNSALDSIADQRLSKVVLAHAIDVSSPKPFNLVKSLQNLRKFYPDCYLFVTSNPQGQNFIGASPERLLSIQNNQLITDALAGSAPRGKTPAEDAQLANKLISSQKERHEHRVVIDFIRDRLINLGLNPRIYPEVRLLQLSNIQHLWTPIKATISPQVHPLDILAELHPTPAVAGVPRDIACEEIRRYETFDRCLYAAPIGWVDAQGNAEFIVGIRSALITGCHARLYAGAGIVQGSNPAQELAEIDLKLQALLKTLV